MCMNENDRYLDSSGILELEQHIFSLRNSNKLCKGVLACTYHQQRYLLQFWLSYKICNTL